MTPVISFVGNSNCGKTTYLIKLIAAMKQEGYKVGIIKHDVHGFQIDRPGKDTWRHAQAGADIVCISSPQKMALIKKVDNEIPLAELVSCINDVDIIFTEGYKREAKNKIEIFRPPISEKPICPQEELWAIVSDVDVYEGLPRFGLDDIPSMIDFLKHKMADLKSKSDTD